MPSSALPPDPWVGALLRRLLIVAVAILILARIVPRPTELPAAASGDGSSTVSTRVLPVVSDPVFPPGDGTLVPPFDADDVEASVAGWALLDRAAGEVLVLDPQGAPVRRLGRRGDGPGELERPLDVALAPDGSVAVLDASGQRLDLFPTTGLPHRVLISGQDCNGTFGEDVVHHQEVWWVLRRCFEGVGSELEVVRVPPEGSPTVVARRVLTEFSSDPLLVPLLVADGESLYAGNNREPCLRALDEATPVGRLCLPHPAPAPIPDSVATRLFGDLGRRAAAVGFDLNLPTHYPGVVEVRRRLDGPAVRTIRPDGSDAWAVSRGDTLRLLAPGGGARIEPGLSQWLMLRDDARGLRLWIVDDPHTR